MTKTEKESFSFGRYLQSMRLKKKISLETISEETRVAIGNLRLIEKEDLEALPDQVFVKGFCVPMPLPSGPMVTKQLSFILPGSIWKAGWPMQAVFLQGLLLPCGVI